MSSPVGGPRFVAGPLLALLLTVVAVVLVGVHATSVLTVPAGLLLVLVLPGYVWVHAFFEGDSQPLVRPALIVGSSLGITMVVGLLADVMPDGVTRGDWCIGFEVAVVLGVVVTLVRAALGAPAERSASKPPAQREGSVPGGTRLAVFDGALSTRRLAMIAAEVLSLVVLLVATGWISVTSESKWEARQHFSALSIAGVGSQKPTVEVTNHEGRGVTYTVKADLFNRQVLADSLRVPAGQTRRLVLAHILAPLRPAQLLVTLDRPGARSPYRQVWLRAHDGLWG